MTNELIKAINGLTPDRAVSPGSVLVIANTRRSLGLRTGRGITLIEVVYRLEIGVLNGRHVVIVEQVILREIVVLVTMHVCCSFLSDLAC